MANVRVKKTSSLFVRGIGTLKGEFRVRSRAEQLSREPGSVRRIHITLGIPEGLGLSRTSLAEDLSRVSYANEEAISPRGSSFLMDALESNDRARAVARYLRLCWPSLYHRTYA